MNISSECIFSLFPTILSFKKEVQPLHKIQHERTLPKRYRSCRKDLEEFVHARIWPRREAQSGHSESDCRPEVFENVLVRRNSVKCNRIKCWYSTASSVPLAATSSMVRELRGGKLFPDVAANHHLLVCSVTPSEKTRCKHE